ncbi:MAG: PQQ-binding-like beta-propeller repeat protein [Thermoanaerobaculia bacterium]
MPSSPAAQPAPAAAIDAASFPQFLGPDRDGRIAGVELSRDWQARPPRELWRRPVGAGWAGFSVAGGMAFTLEQEGEEEVATAYELATGKRLWRHADRTRYETTVGGVGPRSVPTVAGDRVFVMGATSHLRALDRESGRLLWQRDLKQGEGKSPPWGKANSPLVVGEQVIVQAGGETGSALAAFDAASGRPLWQGGKDPGSSSYSSPVLLAPAGEAQVVSFNSDSVSAHDPADGHPLWRYPWPAEQPNVSTPLLLPGDRLFASSGYGVGSKLLQLSRGEAGEWTAKLVWESPRLKAKFTNVVFSDGYLYGLDDGTLVCLDPGTGERCWKSGRYGHGQVLLIGKTLLVTTEEGELVLVAPDPREHRELARLSVLGGKSWNPPAFASPYLLWRDDREAVCLELPLEQPGR